MAKNSGRSATVIASIAFGLALGVAGGTYILAPNLSGGANEISADLEQQRDQALHEAEIAEAQAATADSFIDTAALDFVAGSLTERPVLIMHTEDADADDIASVRYLLDFAGAINSGTIELKDKFFNQSGADGLKNIVSTTLPAGATLSTDQLDAGTHAGQSLGSALLLNRETAEQQSTIEERAIVLGGLRGAGYISYEEGTILPAQAIVFIVGNKDGFEDNFTAQNQAAFARALNSRGSGVVVAGRIFSAADTGVMGILRDNALARQEVSTVDSVDRTWGRIATVLAVREQLTGGSGQYGAAASAEAASPAPNMRG
ncbi:copper transporter [Corynebacterium kutscheri]|uniref:copper transporter n=1 Tax=Corynebacterium kutscheri TaxID=35755 RepID=UPI0037BECFA5